MNYPEIQITKSWRKSISMSFNKQGVLQVHAPKFMLSYQIQDFLSKNDTWIEKHFLKIRERKENKKYYLFGEELTQLPPTSLRSATTLDVEGFNELPLIEGDVTKWQEEYKKWLEKYYKQEAKKYIIPRCQELAEKYDFMYKWIRITSATTRWGSCSSKKTLNFSYRLIMAPSECIDYVIIHELCHLWQMNHSAKFWSEVASIMPSYKIHEKHLKTHGWKYTL